MPHLLNFLTQNGTFNTNDHTVLISHTGGGILSSLTGLYPDRHGQAVSNYYGYFTPAPGVGFSSSFKYWTDNTDGGNPANNPPTASARHELQHGQHRPAVARRHGRGPQRACAWVPLRAAGCDVGNVGTANAVLENNTSIVSRVAAQATTLAAAAPAGSTNVKVASVAGLSAGQNVILENATPTVELATIQNVGTTGSGGTGVTLTAPTAKAHASGGAFTVYATDPTGDMTRCSARARPNGSRAATRRSPRPARRRAQPRADRLRRLRDPLRRGGGICAANPNAEPDPLPDEAGGYTGFKALFGAKYVNPAITGGSPRERTDGSPITDPFGQCGFPGFDGMFAEEHARLRRADAGAGVPVTFALHLRRARRPRQGRRRSTSPTGRARPATSSSCATTTRRSASFFDRLQSDGITKDNTLFVVTVEEGDHFAGTAPDGPCDGVTTPCTYANGHVTEVNGDLKRLVATYNASHGTNATTNFSVHTDMAPNVYVTGNPARDSSTARTLEQAMADMNVKNPLSGKQQNLFVAMADPVEQKSSTWRPRTRRTADVHAVRPGRLLPQRLRRPVREQRPQRNCLFLPNTAGPRRRSRGTTADPARDRRPGSVGSGRGSRTRAARRQVCTDHTDVRPTISRCSASRTTTSRTAASTRRSSRTTRCRGAHGKTAEELGQA